MTQAELDKAGEDQFRRRLDRLKQEPDVAKALALAGELLDALTAIHTRLRETAVNAPTDARSA